MTEAAESPVVDFWTNVRSDAAARAWRENGMLSGVASYFETSDASRPRDHRDVLADMDEHGVDVSVVTGMVGIEPVYPSGNFTIDEVLGWCEEQPHRLQAAMNIDGLGSVGHVCAKIDEYASHPGLGLVRVVPISVNEPINSPRFYPVYERCQAHGIPVSINVGVPGPKMRVRYQDPMLLDDVLIDFPELTVVAAHMGHPWEPLLVRFMRKYERLHLCNSAWLAKYLDPDVVRFMDSSAGRDRLIFASDAPLLGLGRALEAARALDVSPEAKAGFLGANAARVLGLDVVVRAGVLGADRFACDRGEP